MRLYGQRFAKRFVDGRVSLRTETRDAILWDIDWNNYEARVKIQGTNELVIAHFPRNWKTQPYWLKKGNAIRVLHREGIRGYVEVIGEGRAIPTPVTGSVLPPEESLPDMILTGCVVSESTPPQMGVYITSGTFRLNGTVYYLTPDVTGYIIMDDPPPMTMGSGDLMGSGGYTVSFDPAPTTPGYWRYDAICVGEDLVIDYIKGVESTEPVKPAIPSDHLQLGDYILVQWGVTAIYNKDIGFEWYQALPTMLEITAVSYTGTISGEQYFEWYNSGETYWPNPECYIKFDVLDQYGEPIAPGAGGYSGTLDMMAGTGDIWSLDTGYSSSEVSQDWSTHSYYNFKYRRNEVASPHEASPIVMATLDYSPEIKTAFTLYLTSGEYVYPNY